MGGAESAFTDGHVFTTHRIRLLIYILYYDCFVEKYNSAKYFNSSRSLWLNFECSKSMCCLTKCACFNSSMKKSIRKSSTQSKALTKKNSWPLNSSASFSNIFHHWPMRPLTRRWTCAKTRTFKFVDRPSKICRNSARRRKNMRPKSPTYWHSC